jgi:hypothetical protein
MRKLGCGIGAVLLVLAVAGGLVQVVMSLRGSGVPLSAGWLWFQIDGNSLVGFQALIEKRVSPALWTPIQTVLTWPVWLALGIPGPALALSCLALRRREPSPR